MRFKFQKTWLILGVAATIGLFAALATRSYLSNQVEALEARGKVKTVNVLVARQELKQGDHITTETVAVRAIPVDYANSAAITPDAYERVEGQSLSYPVKAGEMILWSLLEEKKGATFSARVEVGHRAMTVPVDEINSISGLLEPGDLIDLLVSLELKGKKTTLPLLQSVKVLATGQRSVDTPSDNERKSYSTVTIDTSPDEARNLVLAREAGKITALLRNPQDAHHLDHKNVDIAALLDKAAAASEGIGSVPVIYGGNAQIAPESLVMHASGRPSTAPSPLPAGAESYATLDNVRKIAASLAGSAMTRP